MSSAQMRDLVTGANGLQPYKFPTILYLSAPPHNFKSDLYPFDKSQSPRNWQQQAIAATPTPKDENLRAPRYHDRSCDRQTQKYHVQSEHLVPQTDVSKHGTLKAHWNAGSSEPCGKDDPGRTRARDPGQGTAAVAVGAVQPNGCQPPGAPPMRPVPLPGQEVDKDISYYGPGLAPGSWLAGTVQVEDVPKDLSRLDMALPVPFA
ncbi:hypothetical protein V8E52_000975 [Russula decolorans]